MKKTLITLIAVSLFGIATYAQNDTTKVSYRTIKWEKVTETSKSGEQKSATYVTIDGECYTTNRESMDRYNAIIRFKGTPVIVKITNKRYPKGRIVTL